MKKKGFTLLETISLLVIVALIVAFAYCSQHLYDGIPAERARPKIRPYSNNAPPKNDYEVLGYELSVRAWEMADPKVDYVVWAPKTHIQGHEWRIHLRDDGNHSEWIDVPEDRWDKLPNDVKECFGENQRVRFTLKQSEPEITARNFDSITLLDFVNVRGVEK